MSGPGKRKRFSRAKRAELAKEVTRKVFCDEALGHLKAGNYLKALSAFNTALEICPTDKTALVARSKCHLLIGDPKQALADAEAALAIDKGFIKALFQKAEALYHLGDFEHSLMYYHRGLRIRPEMQGFRLGIQKAQEAIENVIGNNKCPFPSSPRLLKAMFSRSKSSEDTATKPQNVVKIGGLFQTEQTSTKAIRRSERRLLGDLYEDKQYLEQLLKNPDIISLNQDFANNDVAAHAEEGIAFLKARQEFWRQQKPNTIVATKTKVKSRKVAKAKKENV